MCCQYPVELRAHSVYVAGQSNGETLGAWGVGAGVAANFANVAVGGSQMTTWAQGQANYNSMLAAAAGSTHSTIFIYWVHGEGDSITEANADAYEGRFNTMKAAFEGEASLSSYTIKWIIHRLHDDLDPAGRPFHATVRAALVSIIAAHANAYGYDPNGFSLFDSPPVHYDLGDNAARQAGMDGVRMATL